MGRVVAVALGVLMTVAGALWTFRGLGYLGAAESNSTFLATIGPLVAGLGVALVFVAVRGPGHR